VRAALTRRADLVIIAFRSREAAVIAQLQFGVRDACIIDRDQLSLPEDMSDPLTDDGRSNPDYSTGFLTPARALGRPVWAVFGSRVSPDLVVDRSDQGALHYSTFQARDYDEADEMACSWVIVIGRTNLSLLGSKLTASVLGVHGRLENLAVPVVSLIDCFALGGGNELVMSTHFWIVTENAQIGQPEIKLGIFPGDSGMQRLPRLVGPRRAAELILNGEPVDRRVVVSLGLADALGPAATALRMAFQVAQELASGVRSFVPRLGRTRRWPTSWAGRTAGHLPAAPAPAAGLVGDLRTARRYAARIALDALRTGFGIGFATGLVNDARLFGQEYISLRPRMGGPLPGEGSAAIDIPDIA